MSGSDWDSLPDIREWSGGFPKYLGGPLGCPGVFGRYFQMSGRPTRMFRSGRKALLDVRDWTGGPPG